MESKLQFSFIANSTGSIFFINTSCVENCRCKIIHYSATKSLCFSSSTDKSDMLLAVIETHRDNESLQEDSLCRLYEVGAVKTDDDMVCYTLFSIHTLQLE